MQTLYDFFRSQKFTNPADPLIIYQSPEYTGSDASMIREQEHKVWKIYKTRKQNASGKNYKVVCLQDKRKIFQGGSNSAVRKYLTRDGPARRVDVGDKGDEYILDDGAILHLSRQNFIPSNYLQLQYYSDFTINGKITLPMKLSEEHLLGGWFALDANGNLETVLTEEDVVTGLNGPLIEELDDDLPCDRIDILPDSSFSPGQNAPCLLNAKRIKIPKDNSCLFHALAYGPNRDKYAGALLRKELLDWLSSHSKEKVENTTWEEWIWSQTLHDPAGGVQAYRNRSRSSRQPSEQGMSVDAYVSTMSKPREWGGEIEIAIFHHLKRKPVWLFEHVEGDKYRRVTAFGSTDVPLETVVALVVTYGDDAVRNIVHYDALELFAQPDASVGSDAILSFLKYKKKELADCSARQKEICKRISNLRQEKGTLLARKTQLQEEWSSLSSQVRGLLSQN
jgi:hypothetical protein